MVVMWFLDSKYSLEDVPVLFLTEHQSTMKSLLMGNSISSSAWAEVARSSLIQARQWNRQYEMNLEHFNGLSEALQNLFQIRDATEEVVVGQLRVNYHPRTISSLAGVPFSPRQKIRYYYYVQEFPLSLEVERSLYLLNGDTKPCQLVYTETTSGLDFYRVYHLRPADEGPDFDELKLTGDNVLLVFSQSQMGSLGLPLLKFIRAVELQLRYRRETRDGRISLVGVGSSLLPVPFTSSSSFGTDKASSRPNDIFTGLLIDALHHIFSYLSRSRRILDLRRVCKSLRAADHSDSEYWRTFLEGDNLWDENAKPSATLTDWCSTEGWLERWRALNQIDSKSIENDVFLPSILVARAPAFWKKRRPYPQWIWKQEAIMSTNSGTRATETGLSFLCFGGWIDYETEWKPLTGRRVQGSLLQPEYVETLERSTDCLFPYLKNPFNLLQMDRMFNSGYANLFYMLTDPDVAGKDGVRLTFRDVAPSGASPETLRARVDMLLNNDFFPPLYCSGKISVSEWIARPRDEVALWNRMRHVLRGREGIEFDQPYLAWFRVIVQHELPSLDSCFVGVMEALLLKKRDLHPNEDTTMVFDGVPETEGLAGPHPRTFLGEEAKAVYTNWVMNEVHLYI